MYDSKNSGWYSFYYFIHIFELNLRSVGTEDVLGIARQVLGLDGQLLGLDGQLLGLGLDSQVLGLGLVGQVLGLGLVTSGVNSKSVEWVL